MVIAKAPLQQVIELENKIFLLKVLSPEIARNIKPGQFLNVLVTKTYYPLLRRPFSVCDVEDDYFYLMFNIFGEGTKLLSKKHPGELIDVLGPLGNGFNLDGDYETAVIVAGGLGAAPFPFVVRSIQNKKNIISFIGGRTQNDVIMHGMKNIHIATDDGSLGFRGTVVELLKNKIDLISSSKIKIFGCGPTAMLRTLREFAIGNNFNCEVSTECAMACGFGICQGCPIEGVNSPDKYLLVCKNGPVFNVKDIVL
ncbi:MAG: dihydroorotate dehydrogenase electron transfer subunit [Ignavibacteriaceae bacterium]